jgi:hypothetical protein
MGTEGTNVIGGTRAGRARGVASGSPSSRTMAARGGGASALGGLAACTLAAATVAMPAPNPRAEGSPPISLCPLVRGGTRVVCRLPEDACDGGLVTLYSACVGDTANDSSPGRSVEIGTISAFGEFRPVPRPCFDEIPVYRCSCTPLGDYCAPGSACKRTAVLAGTVIPAGGYQQLVRCQPIAEPARRPGGAGDA